MPLPKHDFDPTEAALPWKAVKSAGHVVKFATPDGTRGYADPIMLSGEGLDPWGFIPVVKKLRLFGLLLRADKNGRRAYREMEQDPEFLQPLSYEQLDAYDFDGLILPGGHARGMRVYQESKTLQRFVAEFFDRKDEHGDHPPIGAICHGVTLASRAISTVTGKSVLYGKKTTALPWRFEKTAWLLCR